MNYSKITTNFETQAMAFSRLRVSLPYPEYIIRGYDNGSLRIYKSTVDHDNPILLLTLNIRASLNKDEVGFFQKSPTEATIVGRDVAFKAPDLVKQMLNI